MADYTETLGISIADVSIVATGYRASKLLGATVFNDEGQEIGKIKDFVVTHRHYIVFAILGVGGFLGLGEKDVAIPARQFTGLGGKVILPGATKDALLKLSSFQFSKN